MKRKRVLLASTLVAGVVLAGCSSQPSEGEPAEVTVWMFPVIADETASRDYWASVEEGFADANPDIDLTVELLPWDNREQKIATAIAAGEGPDIVLLTPDQALNYQLSGGLEPVTDAIADEKDAFLPSALDAVTFDGELYGVPLYHTATTAVYNKSLFEAAGIADLPETWDEILAAAPLLADQGVAVMDYVGSPSMTLNLSFYPLLWQAGGSVFTEDGTDTAFDSAEGEAALQFLLDLQAEGGIPSDAAVKENKIEGGALALEKAAMAYAFTQAETVLLQPAIGEENVVVGLPLTNVEQVTYGVPAVLGLTTINENREAAYAALRYMTSPDVSHELQKASGNYPTRTDTPPPGDDATTAAFMEALPFTKPGEVVPNARQVMTVLAPQLQAALQGQKTARQALADAAAEARVLLGK